MPSTNFNMAELKTANIGEFHILLNRVVTLHVAWLKEQGFESKMIGTITCDTLTQVQNEVLRNFRAG